LDHYTQPTLNTKDLFDLAILTIRASREEDMYVKSGLVERVDDNHLEFVAAAKKYVLSVVR
jgi:hypothetical protein